MNNVHFPVLKPKYKKRTYYVIVNMLFACQVARYLLALPNDRLTKPTDTFECRMASHLRN